MCILGNEALINIGTSKRPTTLLTKRFKKFYILLNAFQNIFFSSQIYLKEIFSYCLRFLKNLSTAHNSTKMKQNLWH